jgi:hypothetical protein
MTGGKNMSQVSQHHKKTRVIAVVALIAGVLGLGVAFAALSTNLLIKGTATVKNAEWDVHWEAPLNCVPSGEAAVVASPATQITTTTDTNDTVKVSAEFKANGDKVVCTFTAKNDGTIAAVIDGYAATLTNLGDIDVTAVLNNSDTSVSSSAPADGEPLAAGASDQYTLTLTYTGDLVGQASAAKTFEYTIPYVQASATP